MARNFEGKSSGEQDFAQLQSVLVNSKTQQKNNALFQVVQTLIKGSQSFSEKLKNVLTKDDKINLKTQVTDVLSHANGGANVGYYFPTLVIAVNVDPDPVAFYSHYLRFANYVVVVGKITAIATAGGTLAGVDISLPIPTNLVSADELHGVANGLPLGAAVLGVPATVTGNTTNMTAALRWFPENTDDTDFRFIFSYQVK